MKTLVESNALRVGVNGKCNSEWTKPTSKSSLFSYMRNAPTERWPDLNPDPRRFWWMSWLVNNDYDHCRWLVAAVIYVRRARRAAHRASRISMRLCTSTHHCAITSFYDCHCTDGTDLCIRYWLRFAIQSLAGLIDDVMTSFLKLKYQVHLGKNCEMSISLCMYYRLDDYEAGGHRMRQRQRCRCVTTAVCVWLIDLYSTDNISIQRWNTAINIDPYNHTLHHSAVCKINTCVWTRKKECRPRGIRLALMHILILIVSCSFFWCRYVFLWFVG